MGKVDNPTQYPYSPVGLLHVTLDGGGEGWGTGTLINDRDILTCGHNLLYQGRYATSATFYPNYSANQRPPAQSGLSIGAGFLPKPFTRKDVTWDIGVYRLKNPQYTVRKFMTPTVVTQEQEPPKVLRIAGYPGNHHFEMWEDEQTWSGVDIGLHVFTYAHQTEAGSSGSPVFRIEGPEGTARIYGVHRGVLPDHEDKVGVLITEVTDGFIQAAIQARESEYFITPIGD